MRSVTKAVCYHGAHGSGLDGFEPGLPVIERGYRLRRLSDRKVSGRDASPPAIPIPKTQGPQGSGPG